LQPEWEQLAGAVQGFVTIAYWDTQQNTSRRRSPPRLLGEIQGTPTLRLYKPKRKQRPMDSNVEKIVIDYRHGERTVKDMKTFLENEMPNYSERIIMEEGRPDMMDKIMTKANKYGLPVALLFTSKFKTSPLVKFLSTEFRRRLLLVEIPPITNNQPLWKDYGIEKETLPVLLVIPPASLFNNNGTTTTSSSDQILHKFDGDKFTRRKLQDFLSQHALKEPVYKPKEQVVTTTTASGKDQQPEVDPSKTEL
jgi:hypothetical protein